MDIVMLNTLPYSLESIETLDEILKKVYGIDLLNPPSCHYPHLEIQPQLYKQLWQERTVQQWQIIRSHFNVTDVVTRTDWRLSLPIVATNDEYILYEIPYVFSDTQRGFNYFYVQGER